MKTRMLRFALVVTCLAMSAIARTASADDTPASDATQPVPATEAAKTEPTTSDPALLESPVDPYAVPENASPEELLAFIQGLTQVKPKSTKVQEQVEQIRQLSSAMIVAADKILASDAAGKIRLGAVDAKIRVFSMLVRIGDRQAEEQLAALGEKLKEDTTLELAGRARWIPFQVRTYRVLRGDLQGAPQLLADLPGVAADAPDPTTPAQIVMTVAPMLEANGMIDKPAIQACHAIIEVLSRSASPIGVRGAKTIEGLVRKLELIGNPIALNGTLLSGETFDQSSLKGKVVLVDFWATWCGPCLRELPNVQECYKKYHDKGFEIVGISLDTDRERLEQFIKEREIPWPILFEPKPEDQRWTNPIVRAYGISGIPAMFIIGADGNVISLSARGKRLGEILEKQLGTVEPTATVPEATAPEEKPAT